MPKLGQQSQMLVRVLAPRDLPLDRHSAHTWIGGKLVSGMENFQHARFPDLHLAGDHRNPRAFEAAMDGKNCACDCDSAVLCLNVEMAALPLSSLNDDVAAI